MKDLNKYIAVERLYGRLAVKARSKNEAALARRLQGVFDKAKKRILKKMVTNGQLQRTVALASLDPLYNEVGDLIYQSVLVEAAGAPASIVLLQELAFQASTLTMNRLKGDLNTTLTQAYQQGLGTKETAELIKGEFKGLTSYEAERIARTEVNSAQSNARIAKMYAAGVQYVQWWSANDKRTRSSHEEIHGLIVRKGDTFPNGLKHPHDRSGPIGEWISCRCRPIPFLMPANMAPPPGKQSFYEYELIRLAA